MDFIHGEVILSMGQFIFLAGLAIYGLFMAGVALAVGITNLWQRDQMYKEMKKYNSFLLEVSSMNKLWYGDPNSQTSFPGLDPQMEFLEDRD